MSLRYYELNTGCQNLASDLEIDHDKSVIAWGRDAAFYALKADSNLAHVWSKHFDRHGGFQFIKELPGGDLLAGINMDTAGAAVARMDPDGNFLWCKSYIRPGGMVHDAVIESDSSFIITGYTDSIQQSMFLPLPASFHPKLFMMKLDGTGAVQWCKGYESTPDLWYTPQWSRIEKAQDGKYVVLATLGYPQNNQFHRPFLMKTDLNGDTLWTRSSGKSGYDYKTSSLLASSDGGFLYDGTTWGSFPPASGASFLFKTDSLGHLPCYKLHYPIEVSDLFPTDSSFTLTSVDGATAYPASVQDTTYGAITVYDGCTFTTGIAHTLSHARPPKVHPNPTTGRFTVEFPDPLTVDSFYSVYDAVGQLLFQRPLAKGQASEEIDLSRYGKGMYLIRFTDRDGVCSERVVVQ
ncbi:MAG: T9SS type A sorting domain-containing protein [Flavobacteriales bacterium]